MNTLYNDMALFAEVVTAGSFTAASRRTGIPLSTLSRRIKTLEQYLDAALLSRTTRRLELTEAGHLFLMHCREVVRQGFEAEQKLQNMKDEPVGKLVIGASMAVDDAWGSDAIARFLRLFPQITVEHHRVTDPADLDRREMDSLLWIGHRPDTHHQVLPFGVTRGIVCGSSDYFREHGYPRKPEDLSRHHMVNYSDLPWEEWGPEAWRSLPINSRLATNEAVIARQMVCSGIGLGFLPEVLVRHQLENASLQHILPDAVGDIPLWLVISRNRREARRLDVFLEHMMASAADSAPWEFPA